METTTPRVGEIVLNKFRVEAQLGRGGMGEVLSVRNLSLDQCFAMKVMRGDRAMHTTAERFRREARVAARVRSPHVASVFDAGRLDDGTEYLLMEYLQGETLLERVRRDGALPPSVAVDVALQVCLGLAAVHAVGIVHRDLKLENIFLVDHGECAPVAKVLDFGIAKLAREGSMSRAGEALTSANGGLGTPPYLPPEQVLSPSTADARSDIYALGACMYLMLTRRPAFSAPDQETVLRDILAKPPTPLRLVRDDVPAELEAIVLKCLAKEREQRYRDVAELAADLGAFLGARGRIPARRVATRLGERPTEETPTTRISLPPSARGKLVPWVDSEDVIEAHSTNPQGRRPQTLEAELIHPSGRNRRRVSGWSIVALGVGAAAALLVPRLEAPRSVVDITREFDAPREIVFNAWVDPDQVSAWWGCNMTTAVTSTVEPCVGGVYRHVMTLGDMGEHPYEGVITEFDPPNLLTYEADLPACEQFGSEAMHVRNRVEFNDLGGRTQLVITVTGITNDTMKGIISGGTADSIGKLTKFLDASVAG